MKIFLTLLLLLTNFLCAKDLIANTIMSEHINPGCPFNSTCGPEMGALFLKYQHALDKGEINQFFKNYGLPITGRRKKETNPNRKIEAVWDSPCGYKENKESTNERVLNFTKNLNNSSLEYPLYTIIDSNNKIYRYKASNDDSALGFDQKRLVFNRLIRDVYYQYNVGQKGDLQIGQNIEFPSTPHPTSCTSQLLGQIKPYYTEDELQRINCRVIYGKKGQQSYLFYLPRCE